jgi:hypothetical protein
LVRGVDTDHLTVLRRFSVVGEVEAGKQELGVVQAGLDPEPTSAPVAGGEPFVDLPVGHAGVEAPALTELLGTIGVLAEVARLAAEHGHLGVGKQVGNEPAVDGAATEPENLPTTMTWAAASG